MLILVNRNKCFPLQSLSELKLHLFTSAAVQFAQAARFGNLDTSAKR